MEAIKPVRTQDPIIRAQQWALLASVTGEMADVLDQIRRLRPFIQASEDYLHLLRLDNRSTWENRATIFKGLQSARKSLVIATEACSALQSALEALQTALQDTED
jgi:hypothetical protein